MRQRQHELLAGVGHRRGQSAVGGVVAEGELEHKRHVHTADQHKPVLVGQLHGHLIDGAAGDVGADHHRLALGQRIELLSKLALEFLALDVPVEEVDVVCVRLEELHGLRETFRERGVGGDEDLAHTSASA